MKIQIASDIHLEFTPNRGPGFDNTITNVVDRDALVLAGDIGVGTGAKVFLEKQLKISPVIYVPGNHEYYGHEISLINAKWREIAAEFIHDGLPHRLYFLNPGVAVIKDTQFVGCALWTDFNRLDSLAMNAARFGMNDYRNISYKHFDGGPVRIFQPENAAYIHERHRKFIYDELRDTDAKYRVVVTHMAPHAKSIHPKYAHQTRDRGLLNHAYYSDLEYLILETKPDLWIHGHTHARAAYKIGETAVVCNPRGYYMWEEVEDYDPAYTITLEGK